jgi:hypothetical protein
MSDTIETLKAAKALIDTGMKRSAIEAINTVIEALQSGEPVGQVCWAADRPNSMLEIRCVGDVLLSELGLGTKLYTAPQPVSDVNQKLVADEYVKLEPALEALVSLCNNLNIGNYDEVIASEAALERLYLAWRAALLSAGKGGE